MYTKSLSKKATEFKKRILKEPTNIELLVEYARLKRQIGWQLGDRRHAQEALKHLNKAISIEPNNHFIYLERGVTHFTLGQQDNAIMDFNRSIELLPTSRAYYNLGASKWQKYIDEFGNKDNITKSDEVNLSREVISYYDEALKLDPNNINAIFNNGVVCLKLGEFNKSKNYFSKVVEHSPKDHNAYFYRALCFENLSLPRYSNQQALQKAISDYTKAIELSPNYVSAYYNRAVCYEHLGPDGRYSDLDNVLLAINDYSTILSVNPSDNIAMLNRGWAYEHLGDIENTIKDFKQAIENSVDPHMAKIISKYLDNIENSAYKE